MTLRIEIVYATPAAQTLLPIELAAGATVGDAIERSGVLAFHPEIDLAHAKVGIFGRVCSLETVLRDGDRVEIYRPLVADPKDRRRRIAARVAAATPKGQD